MSCPSLPLTCLKKRFIGGNPCSLLFSFHFANTHVWLIWMPTIKTSPLVEIFLNALLKSVIGWTRKDHILASTIFVKLWLVRYLSQIHINALFTSIVYFFSFWRNNTIEKQRCYLLSISHCGLWAPHRDNITTRNKRAHCQFRFTSQLPPSQRKKTFGRADDIESAISTILERLEDIWSEGVKHRRFFSYVCLIICRFVFGHHE